MKAKLTIAVVLASCLLLAAAVFAVATARATQVTATSAVTADKIAETDPDLSGTNLVWQEQNGDDWNVYYGDATAGTLPGKVTVLTAPGDQIRPRVSETDPGQPDNHVLVVWEDHRNGDADIDGYDMTTGKALAICTDAGEQAAPRISGDWVVWQDDRNGNWDIYGATIDPTTDTVSAATPICDESYDRIEPDVSGDTVVWVDNSTTRTSGVTSTAIRSRSASTTRPRTSPPSRATPWSGATHATPRPRAPTSTATACSSAASSRSARRPATRTRPPSIRTSSCGTTHAPLRPGRRARLRPSPTAALQCRRPGGHAEPADDLAITGSCGPTSVTGASPICGRRR